LEAGGGEGGHPTEARRGQAQRRPVARCGRGVGKAFYQRVLYRGFLLQEQTPPVQPMAYGRLVSVPSELL